MTMREFLGRRVTSDLLTQSDGHLGLLAGRDAELGDEFVPLAAVTVAGASFEPGFAVFFVVSESLCCEQSLSWFVLHSQAETLMNSRR